MTENKAAARVLEHPNGQKRELSQTHKNIYCISCGLASCLPKPAPSC